MKKSLFLLGLMFSLILGSSSYARVLMDHGDVHSQDYEGASEALVVVNFPIEIVQRQIKTLLLSDESPIKEVLRLDFDPLHRLFLFEGVIELPVDLLRDLEASVGKREVKKNHHFKLSLSFPSARLLSLTSYLQLTINRLEIDGQDYSSATDIMGRFVSAILANPSFVDYVLGEDRADAFEGSTTMQIRQFIERKNLRFRDNTVSFKLNLKEFTDFRNFSEITELRLWQFSPVLLRGLNQTVFRMEAGVGRPDDLWLNDIRARGENDTRVLTLARDQYYQEFSQTKHLLNELKSFIDEFSLSIDFKAQNPREERELKSLVNTLENKMSKTLSRDNPEFEAAPQETYNHLSDVLKEQVITTLSDLKRRQEIDQRSAAGGVDGGKWPFIEKRLSQRALSQAVRFFRDIDFEGEKLFGKLDMILAPHLPGLVIRGTVNLDLNSLFYMSLEGTSVVPDTSVLRAQEEVYGSGIPFEAGIRLTLEDDSRLGIDISSISLFTGLQRMSFSSTQKHGQFMIHFMKMIITETLLTTLMEQPFADTADESFYEKVMVNLQEQRNTYLRSQRGNRDLDQISRLMELAKVDIETNPFLLAGKDFVEGKTELFFKEIIQFDEKDELLKIKLDPKLISESILTTENTVQVWNVESLYDKDFDQTYLELSLGDKRRSKKYVDHLFSRAERTDSQNFTGTGMNPSNVDVSAKINIRDFTRIVSTVLNEAAHSQALEVEKQLLIEREYESYIIQNLTLKALAGNKLALNAVLTHVQKTKRGALNPRRWFGDTFEINRKTITAQATLKLDLVALDQYRKSLKTAPSEVFLSDELVRIDLENIGLNLSGDTSIIDRMVNLLGRDLDFKNSSLAKKLKVLILKIVGPMLNPQDENNGRVELGGVKLNRYVKLFTHQEEILLQVHPHILATAFDVKLLLNNENRGRDIGLIIDQKDQTIRFDFETVGNMAAVDKNELYQIMKSSQDLFAPYLQARSAEELKTLLTDLTLFDRALYNSDMTKPSLFHRLSLVLNQYQGLIDTAMIDMSVIAQINSALNTKFEHEIDSSQSRQITTAGVELMYLISTSMVLKAKIDQLIALIRHYKLENTVSYFDDFIRKSKEIEKRFLRPFAIRYEQEFKERNQKIISKGPTDWNMTYYSDALYCDNVYRELIKLINPKNFLNTSGEL